MFFMKRESRRDFLKALGTSLAAVAIGRCSTLEERDYTEFTKALGNQYDSLSQDKKRQTREVWRNYSEGEKEEILRLYINPDQTYKSLSEKERKEIDFIIQESNRAGFTSGKGYETVSMASEVYPWINTEKMGRNDALIIKDLFDGFSAAIKMAP